MHMSSAGVGSLLDIERLALKWHSDGLAGIDKQHACNWAMQLLLTTGEKAARCFLGSVASQMFALGAAGQLCVWLQG